MHQNFTFSLFILLLIINSLPLTSQQTSPECPYPCLPPPAGVASNYPPPPPMDGGYNNYPPPPPTDGGYNNYPPPSGYLPFYPSPPNFIYTSPPPPDPITPWFPFYRRLPSSATRRSAGVGFGKMFLVGLVVIMLSAWFNSE